MSHLITTKAAEKTCPRCGAPLLAGISEGMNARVDPDPIDAQQEIQALIDGRHTYALLYGELIHRHPGRIRSGLTGQSIHAQHRCPPKDLLEMIQT